MSNTIISRVLENLTSANYIEEHFTHSYYNPDLNTIDLKIINHSIEETYNELYPYLSNFIIHNADEHALRMWNLFVVGVNDLKEVLNKLEDEGYEDNSKEFIVPPRVRKHTLETQIKYLNQLIDRISLLTNTAPSINDSQNRLNSHQSELDGLEVVREGSEGQRTDEASYNAIHYVLAYIYDCLATDINFAEFAGKKSKLEAIGESRVNGAICGNTFYKAFNKFMATSINLENESDLISLGGDKWKEIIIDLSLESERLSTYLTERGL